MFIINDNHAPGCKKNPWLMTEDDTDLLAEFDKINSQIAAF